MKKNVLKAMMALCLCGLLLVNVNVLFARPYGIEDKEIKDGGGGGSGRLYQTMAYCSGASGLVVACTTKVYSEGCSRYFCTIND